ncbi:MAG TPA: cyclic nucleotide-binding domain-containing protein, partial [Desulfurivibrionaceae bacterium]|nr:cyclic nucleotide-binding domain-containing protein [Desulfurivibrionaceae bacterium]
SEGRRVVIDTLAEGGCVGEMSLLDRMPRSASVVATTPTVAMAINETVLRLANPKLCLKLYRSLASILAERLRASDAKYLELATVHAKGKK